MDFCNWVKANYIRNSAIIKRDEYDFTLVTFNSLIPIFDQSFTFPIHVKQMFFLLIQRGKKWSVILGKNPCGKQVIRGVDFDLIDLDIYRIVNDDSYIDLQAPISIPKVIFKIIIVGSSTYAYKFGKCCYRWNESK
jgi:hypothetical protein